jgi:uncharacterized protein YwgA
MKLRDVLLIILGQLGGSIQSKTKIQKLCYFLSIVLNIDFGFRAHYYGPYSSQVESALDDLLGIGFVIATINQFGTVSNGFEIVRYDYSLTKDGKAIYQDFSAGPKPAEETVIAAINRIKNIGDIGYLELSIAAKTYYIISKKSKFMNTDMISNEANSFDWNITDDDISKAVKFLEKMNLVSVKQ